MTRERMWMLTIGILSATRTLLKSDNRVDAMGTSAFEDVRLFGELYRRSMDWSLA